jgi:phenylacetate-CoA ligase
VTKNMLRSVYPDGCTRPSVRRYTELSTSGSTGAPFAVRVDSETLSSARALMFLRAQFSGWQIGEPYLQTGMTLERGAVRYMKDIALRCEYVSAFDLSDAVIDEYLDRIVAKRIEYVMGYAASIYLMARRAQQRGLKITLKGAVSWGDNMFPAYRKCIESQFGCRVTDTYGCSEGIQIAAQCGEAHGGYHIFAPHVLIELIDNGAPVRRGEIGQVIVTRLGAGAMPMIRYEIGDLARASMLDSCNCGRRWPMLQAVEGRSSDVVITPRGNRLIVHFFTGIFEYARSIDSFQVVQETRDSIIVRVVPKGALDQEEWRELRRQIAERGDPDLDVKLEIVANIPLERSNKRRFVVSRLPASETA